MVYQNLLYILCFTIPNQPPVPRYHQQADVGLPVLWRGVLHQGAEEGAHPAALRGEAQVELLLHLLWIGIPQGEADEGPQVEVVQGQAPVDSSCIWDVNKE